jgi:hypothetical protein
MTRSTPHLSLVAGTPEPPRQALRRVPVGAAPSRPGEMPARIVLEVAFVDAASVRAGLRAAVAIEAARCLAFVARRRSLGADAIERRLDAAARVAEPPPVVPIAAHRLADYARQLSAAGPGVADERSPVELLVPSRQMAAWALAAAEAGLPVEEWAQRLLDSAPQLALAWEAASAARAQTLLEWALAQPVSD